jgi:hypothetical protein
MRTRDSSYRGTILVGVPDGPVGAALERLLEVTCGRSLRTLLLPSQRNELLTAHERNPNAPVAFLRFLPHPGGEVQRQDLGCTAGMRSILSALASARAFGADELRAEIRVLCGVVAEIRRRVHEVQRAAARRLARRVGDAAPRPQQCESTDQLAAALASLRSYLGDYGLADQVPTLATIEDCRQDLASETQVLSLLRELGLVVARLEGSPGDTGNREIRTLAGAPTGYRSVLVADDDGYPEQSAVYLERLGYGVTVCTLCEEAEEIIAADPPDVLLCDMQWGDDPGAGRRLMRLARGQADIKLIVALSGSALAREEAPEADDICAGPTAKTVDGAQRLHEAMWRHAEESGRDGRADLP